MAKLPSTFNHEEHEKMGDFSPIPAGEYLAMIVESELKMTKAATEANNPKLGQYVSLKFKIEGGDYDGRTIFTNLNIINPNQQAVEIANKELASICEALGLGPVDDTEELHGKPLVIRVSIKAETAQYPARNEIKGYAAADGFVPTSGKAPAGAARPARPAAAAKPTWKK